MQELTVYEFNEQDRGSPLILPFNRPTVDFQRLKLVGSLGMLVPFTNKVKPLSLQVVRLFRHLGSLNIANGHAALFWVLREAIGHNGRNVHYYSIQPREGWVFV